MNVTLKLPDDLCRDARHRAVDASQSLSAWIADLLARELGRPPQRARRSLAEALGDESLAEGELPLPERRMQSRRRRRFP